MATGMTAGSTGRGARGALSGRLAPVAEETLSLSTRLWFAWLCFFRVLFDGAFAARLWSVRLPPVLTAPPPTSPPSTPSTPAPAPASAPTAALQLLSLLQREGRFVDFLQQDIASFPDADVGAAARIVHDGCRKALRAHATIEPVRPESEGARVVLAAGFAPDEVKLTGGVGGQPPYTGRAAPPRLARDSPRAAADRRRSRRARPRARRGGASMTRFAVGIDLGTTHSALAVAPLDGEAPAPQVLSIPQLVAQGQTDAPAALAVVPLLRARERGRRRPSRGTRSDRFAVGEYARARGVDAPARVIASAKSWLSHPTVDRRAGILPLGAPEDVEKISPVEASWRYLEHLSEAFDARFGGGDARAREAGRRRHGARVVRRVRARAHRRGRARRGHREADAARGAAGRALRVDARAWATRGASRCNPATSILVVDVGGGTTDFSAIAAVEKDGSLELVRVAVGDHILLGGDNMDLALAHLVRQKLELEGKAVDRWQQVSLVHACRAAKERLLSDASLARRPIAIASPRLGAARRRRCAPSSRATR